MQSKIPGTLEELYKARMTAGVPRDRFKILMMHDSPNLKHNSVRTISSVASNKSLNMWSKDADQAFSQSDEMTRYIVLIPYPEFNLPPGTLLRIKRFLYVLSESGDAWHRKLNKAIQKSLGMNTLTGDQALYYQKPLDDKNGKVSNPKNRNVF